jgi:cytidylate kinase
LSNTPTISLVITIDGPAGAGKSTVARLLANRLGFDFLDTGAMYRCVTLAVLRNGISLTNAPRIEALADQLEIELQGDRVLLNGEDVSEEIRTPKIAAAIGLVADNVSVRKTLSSLQRNWAAGRRVVTEGRDQGTEVFSDSPCKIFLNASPEERAQRRLAEMRQRGIETTYEQVLAQQIKRDQDDVSRPVGALRKASDALEICTDGLSLEVVVEKLAGIIRHRLKDFPNCLDHLSKFTDSDKDSGTSSESRTQL